jgi:hypothetical protein
MIAYIQGIAAEDDMPNQLHNLERDLASFFGGGSRRRLQAPARQYGFRVGSNGTPSHMGTLHGPFATRAEAQAAAEAWNAANDTADHDAPYAWAAEVWD